jgi:hypothetical protein
MGIVNRRNAVIGWVVVKAGKRVAKKKAADLKPGTAGDSAKPNKPAVAMGLAGLAGALMFWRRRRGDETGEE